MSKYTQTIKSMLMENIQTGESITDLDDILAISKRAIFDMTPLNVIDSDYRDRLVLGFTLHYLNDEIGLETPLLFKFGLTEKIFNNAEYINGIFDKLDKQVLSDYRTRSVSGTSHDVITDAGTVAHTGDTVTEKTGDDTVKKTGSATDGHTGTVGVSEHIDDVLTKSGSEVTTHNTQDQAVTDGTVVTTGGDKYTETTSNNGTSKSNTGSYGLDTPQNQLVNLRSESVGGVAVPYDATGKGITAAAESDMRYMSNASFADGTVVNSDSQSVSHDASLSREQSEDDTTVTTTRTGTDSLGFSSRQDDRDVQKTTTNTYNETQTHTDNLQDKTEYNSEVTVTDDKLETRDLETTKDGTTGSSETEQNLNLEMIYRSIPLMSVLWNMFDELFMSIY